MMSVLKRFLVFILLIHLLVAFPDAHQAEAPSGFTDKIVQFDEFVREQMRLDGTPGLSVAFLKDGEFWSKGYGYSDLENKVVATPKTMYRLASVSKPITAVGVLQLGERGKIRLDDEVQKYVSYFPRKNWPVTVRQLLGHLGGISHYQNYEVEGRIREHKATREAIAIFENFDLVAEPGTKYHYSTYGYNLLGAIVEQASGESFAQYMSQNVWGPAGMTNTRLDDSSDLIPNRARGYRLVDGMIKNSEFVDVSSRFGGGGTRSTVEDMVRFGESLIRGRLLKDSTRGEMFQSMTTRDGLYTDYGYGWSVEPVNGRFKVSHSGSQPETRTLLYLFPYENFIAAAAMNFEDGTPGPYLRRLTELILGTPWRTSAYSNDRATGVLVHALEAVFDRGHSYYQKNGKPYTSDPKELEKAFDRFRRLTEMRVIKRNPSGAAKQIFEAQHPSNEQPIIVVGSYMASRLHEGKRSYAAGSGAIGFFREYISAVERDNSVPARLKFSPEMVKTVNQLNRDWQPLSKPEVWNVHLTQSNFKREAQLLQNRCNGRSVFPDLSQKFLELGSLLKPEDGLNVLIVAAQLYARNAELQEAMGEAYEKLGEKDKAIVAYQRSIEIDPDRESARDALSKLKE